MNGNQREPDFGILITRIAMHLRDQADRSVAELGLTPLEGRVLAAVSADQEGGVIQRQIAERTGMKAPSVTRMLTDLESRGLITRAPSAEDARQKILSLAPEGRRALDAFRAATARADERALSALEPAQRALVVASLQRIAASLGGDARPPGA